MITKFTYFYETNSNIKIKKIVEEDRIIIKAIINGEEVAHLDMEIMVSAYWYFNDDFTEDEYNEMFPDDELVIFQMMRVEDKYKRGGIAVVLMRRALEEVEKLGYKEVYLNACPIGTTGLQLNDLVKFYEYFDFKPVLHQENNVQMLLSLR